MPDWNFEYISTVRGSSAADTSTVSTLTAPSGARGCLISVETTDARVVFESDTPSTTLGQVFKAGQQPVYVPMGETIKWTSTAAAVSTLNVTWLG